MGRTRPVTGLNGDSLFDGKENAAIFLLSYSNPGQGEITMNNSPSHDPKLLDLKRIAEAGSDEGPQFDKGVQTVIEEIVNKKYFVDNPMRPLILWAAQELAEDSGSTVPASVQEFLDANCWSIDQGVQFARGIAYAEHELQKFRIEEAVHFA